MRSALNAVDITVIVASLLLVSWVGIWVSRRQENTAMGYFLASGKLPWWLIGPSLVATSVSSEQIVGTVGAAYAFGMGLANWEWWTLPTYTLVMVFFIPMYLKSRILTVPEYYSQRFGPRCADIYSWVMLLAYVVVFLVPVLYGGTLTFADLVLGGHDGPRFYWVLWLQVIIVAAYTIRGGLVSVMWTNLLQTLLLIGGGLLLYFYALSKIPGGWGAMVAANPERFHLYHPPDDLIAPFPALICLTLGLGIFYQGTNQVMIQRVMGARSTWDGLMGTIFAGFINFVRPLVTCFLGFVVYHWIHEMHKAPPLKLNDAAFPFTLRELTPQWGLRGIVMAGFLAAVMSTISALINSTATIFSLDVYKKLMNPRASEGQVVAAGRWASLVALIVAALLAPLVARFGGMFLYFQQLVTYTATPFISVFVLGLLWKRANYQGALFGLIGGFIITAAVVLGAGSVLHIKLHWLYFGFIAQVITMVGIAVVSLLTPAPDASRYGTLVWKPSYLKDVLEERRPIWQNLLLWYGVYAVMWVYLYWRFW